MDGEVGGEFVDSPSQVGGDRCGGQDRREQVGWSGGGPHCRGGPFDLAAEHVVAGGAGGVEGGEGASRAARGEVRGDRVGDGDGIAVAAGQPVGEIIDELTFEYGQPPVAVVVGGC